MRILPSFRVSPTVQCRVFEMLYAFRRVNEQLREGDVVQVLRFREELARREVYEEFDAFARWVQA